MLKSTTLVAGLGALGLSASSALAHSVEEARDLLEDRGFYDIRLERATLPYSFNACKRGTRFHIHVDYYGSLGEVDRLGSCDDYSDEPRYRSKYYDRYRYSRGNY